ncbi:hypothetical protein AKO1_002140 [Acrasis kona]|uniref:Uncharacterized protein n=1 Tax=Acrasis kona TaxID=1008807 RepID=A0AAW2Z8W9_9EUKA
MEESLRDTLNNYVFPLKSTTSLSQRYIEWFEPQDKEETKEEVVTKSVTGKRPSITTPMDSKRRRLSSIADLQLAEKFNSVSIDRRHSKRNSIVHEY